MRLGSDLGMYKFLVVDDEELVRRGFRKKIAWAEAGFEFLEPCKNGREAIQRIEQEHPDVVMTDICMPLVDGLEVAAYIADRFPEIIVIVLSGYDEFEYARSALRSRVAEYLLKPITSRELSALVTKLKMRLDETASRRSELEAAGEPSKSPATELTPKQLHADVSRSFSMAKLAEAREYIDRNYANKKLSVDEICRDLFISPSYFSRLLKQHWGKTFIDALTEYRVEKAKQLLSDSDWKTYAIAGEVGYSDPHYFSTIFKKATGVTPSEYRSSKLKSEGK
jgi:YesN/AraC family two-component response regulator